MRTHKVPLSLPSLSGSDLTVHTWSDDEIHCYGISGPSRVPKIGPFIADIFDMRMRRWYTITADHYEPDPSDPEWQELEDPYWCNVLRQTGHRGRDDFNHIDVNDIDGSLSLSLIPHRGPFLDLHPPPTGPSIDHPHIHYTALEDRQYLEYSVETCTWKGERCIFKQSLMMSQVALLDAEIAMNTTLAHSPHVVHFIAYVVDDDGDLRGILFPWAGVTIDTLPTIRWSYFRDIVHGLRDIHALPLSETDIGKKDEPSHGDLFCRNILIMDGVARLIDLNTEGLDYPGDHQAFLNVLLTLKDKAEEDIDRSRIGEMETWLHAGMGFAELSDLMKDW
jgi:hypothetical protein